MGSTDNTNGPDHAPGGQFPMAETIEAALPLLRRPFSPSAVRAKVQNQDREKPPKWGQVIRYIDARLVAECLNLGAGGEWSYAQRLVTITDVAFTATGAALIAISGTVMAETFGGVGGPSWLTWGWSLFIASGIVWVVVLIPIEVMQARLARRFETEATIPDRYWRLGRAWAVFGVIAIVLPLANVYFMVFKPD